MALNCAFDPTFKCIAMTEQGRILEELNDRSREVFRRVVEGYLDTGRRSARAR
jgi:hypothetical protein